MVIPADGEQQDLKLTFAILDKYNRKTYEESAPREPFHGCDTN
jgi:hypothetical protein